LERQLPDGTVAWKITDPTGTDCRGSNALNGRLDLLSTAIDELVDELYTQLHRAVDGGPRSARPAEQQL
jgi:hypothetical protein